MPISKESFQAGCRVLIDNGVDTDEDYDHDLLEDVIAFTLEARQIEFSFVHFAEV